MSVRPLNFDLNSWYDGTTGWLWRTFDYEFNQLFNISGTASIGLITGSGTGTVRSGEGTGLRIPFFLHREPPRRYVSGIASIGEIRGHGTGRVLPVRVYGKASIGEIRGRGRGRIAVGGFGKVILADFVGNIQGAVNLSASGECSIGEIVGRGRGRVIVSASGQFEMVNFRGRGSGTVTQVEWTEEELAAAFALLLAA